MLNRERHPDRSAKRCRERAPVAGNRRETSGRGTSRVAVVWSLQSPRPRARQLPSRKHPRPEEYRQVFRRGRRRLVVGVRRGKGPGLALGGQLVAETVLDEDREEAGGVSALPGGDDPVFGQQGRHEKHQHLHEAASLGMFYFVCLFLCLFVC